MRESRSYQERLEALNGGPLRQQPAAEDVAGLRRALRVKTAPAPLHFTREPIRTTPLLPSAPVAVGVSLEEAIPGLEVAVPRLGTAYTITTALDDFGPHWAAIGADFRRALHGATPLRQRLHTRCGLENLAPEEILFVDLETTGLAATPLFLIGTMVQEGDDLVIRQYLARHYGEEAAVTALFLDLAAEKRLLVTFNGKSFDMPYVRVRAATHGLCCRLEQPHFDLLHECRRVWKGQFPNCKLQTLEQYVCGRPPRVGDIPGMEIPNAYHAFVRDGNPTQLAQIIRHNLIDLVTMAELLVKLPA